ncbi:glutathione S-transferase theta-3-like [Apostichopus japonicus]|uniref:glutathione S-transferase theta-3-like n=1 Tax=Stichopus japonicus TaxID=307972 RepID=UPI003AB1FE82
MSLKVYFDILSQPSRAVLIMCRVNNLNFTPCPIAMRKLEQKSPEFTKVNPFQRVPAIQDGDFSLTESSAILGYLTSKYGCPGHWNPGDDQTKARIQEYMSWHETQLRAHVTPYFVEKGIIPLQTGVPANEESLQRQWKNVMKAFTAVEDYFLKDQPYIGGDQITIADLLGTCEVMQTAGVDPDFTKDHPKMKAWIQRVRNETNPHFDDTHKMVYKFGKISDPGKL